MATPSLLDAFLEGSSRLETVQAQQNDCPSYWTSNCSTLVTTSSPIAFHLGTGERIYRSIVPVVENAQHEIILVTCFWARSPTLDHFNATLRQLSATAAAEGRRLRIRIYFSSSSLLQKLFHTPSLSGATIPPASWTKQLALPTPEDLPGLDLEVKSIFVLPFSVMHPKFIIVDRQTVILPSCNVSWEEWFEGCVTLQGDIVEQFVRFWKAFWASEEDQQVAWPPPGLSTPPHPTFMKEVEGVPTIFLPSPHHRWPYFRFPWQASAPPPPTPLNIFLLTSLAQAKWSVYMQTPNLTAQPVLTALIAALQRGAAVNIITSEKLMRLEQWVTAGTTTSRCVQCLVEQYKTVLAQSASATHDVEAGQSDPTGSLSVSYYTPRPDRAGEPVQSHLKLTITDDEVVVLGSGNQDRASWYTSQELGVAFISREFASKVIGDVKTELEGRKKIVYDSKIID